MKRCRLTADAQALTETSDRAKRRDKVAASKARVLICKTQDSRTLLCGGEVPDQGPGSRDSESLRPAAWLPLRLISIGGRESI